MNPRLHKILKTSSKFIFKSIQSSGKNKYKNIKEGISIEITKTFINHIHGKKRSSIDISERCAMMPLVPKVIEEGNIVERRSNGDIRISKNISKVRLSAILNEKAAHEYSLISCFVDN